MGAKQNGGFPLTLGFRGKEKVSEGGCGSLAFNPIYFGFNLTNKAGPSFSPIMNGTCNQRPH